MKRYLVCVLLAAGCQAPWQLLETGDVAVTLNAVAESSGMLLMATGSGKILKRSTAERAPTDAISVLNGSGAPSTDPVLGLAVISRSDFYAWQEGGLFHSTGGSLSPVAVPLGSDMRPLALGWRPLSVLATSARVFVVTWVNERATTQRVIFQGNARDGWSRSGWWDGTPREASWLAQGTDGTLWAGHGEGAAPGLYRWRDTKWEVVGQLPVTGVTKVAATASQLALLTDAHVSMVATARPQEELGDIRLDGAFMDLCAMPDGRVVVAGAPRGWAASLWVLEGTRWANLRTGTQETLRGVHCAADGTVYAVGEHGMALSGQP